MTDLPKLVNECPRCANHWFAAPFLAEAFASVGIEHGKSSFEMAESYFADYHRKKHPAEMAPR